MDGFARFKRNSIAPSGATTAPRGAPMGASSGVPPLEYVGGASCSAGKNYNGCHKIYFMDVKTVFTTPSEDEQPSLVLFGVIDQLKRFKASA